jgi:hypothetical protein
MFSVIEQMSYVTYIIHTFCTNVHISVMNERQSPIIYVHKLITDISRILKIQRTIILSAVLYVSENWSH